MCDFSLSAVKSRPATVGDKLTTTNFGTTIGFAEIGGCPVAVCLLPGTEIAFDKPVVLTFKQQTMGRLARFRQVDKENAYVHHDALEFPDGQVALLTHLDTDQRATVLQLPAAPRTKAEPQEQRLVEYKVEFERTNDATSRRA